MGKDSVSKRRYASPAKQTSGILEARSEVVRVRVTPTELVKLKQYANRFGLSVSDALRSWFDEDKV